VVPLQRPGGSNVFPKNTDSMGMVTVLELAREIRHLLVSKETGCLTVEYPDSTISIHVADGTIAAERGVLLSCLSRNPLDFHFKLMERPNAGRYVPGASLLLEAIESIEQKSLCRVWEPYAEWRIVFRLDEELHNTFVKQHLTSDTDILRRMLRLSVSGSATLERPTILITEEMERIEEASASGNWHKVLGIGRSSERFEIKQAYRRLARRFHPDRWVSSVDMRHRDRIERTFQHVSRAYIELYRPRQASPQLLVGPKPKQSVWEKISGLGRKSRN
jgi:DnaJ-like protein